MPKKHFAPPSYLQVPLESIVESFLKDEKDINAIWKLENRFSNCTSDESKYMEQVVKYLQQKWKMATATHEEILLLGMAYDYAAGVNCDPKIAQTYYQPLVAQESPVALYRMGKSMLLIEKAAPFFERAAKADYAPALYGLFYSYSRGDKWRLLQRACQLGYAPALSDDCLLKDNLVSGIRASDLGDPEASARVGLYLKSKGNYAEAIKCYEISIEQGNMWTCSSLGLLRWEVKEVQDLAEAARIFRMAIQSKEIADKSSFIKNLKALLTENPSHPEIIYHAGIANQAPEAFNNLAKTQMSLFVALSMEDKWEDIYKVLAPELREVIFKKREERRIEIQAELVNKSIPAPVARMIRFFESETPAEVKIQEKTPSPPVRRLLY